MSVKGFFASSACVHRMEQHADDVKKVAWLKLCDFAGYFARSRPQGTYPGSQVTQSSGSLFPLVPLYLPTGQGSGTFAPCGQYPPGGHNPPVGLPSGGACKDTLSHLVEMANL